MFIGIARFSEHFNYFLSLSVFVKFAFSEPTVVYDTVFFQIAFKRFHVFRKRKCNKCLFTFGIFRLDIFIAVNFSKCLCVFNDIFAVIRILGHFDAVFEKLQIAERKAQTEFFNLITSIVDIKLSVCFITRKIKNGSKTVAVCAAARISYVHGTRRICGNELNKYALALSEIALSVILTLGKNAVNNRLRKFGTEFEVYESTRNGDFGKP